MSEPRLPASTVLATIRDQAEFRDAQGFARLCRWLREGLRGARHAQLEHKGIRAVELARVFIDIVRSTTPDVDKQREGTGIVAELLATAPTRLRWPLADRPAGLQIDVSADMALDRALGVSTDMATSGGRLPIPPHPAREPARPGLLLIAGPGQGKSTVTQYLTQLHRAALLTEIADQLDDEERAIIAALQAPPPDGPDLPTMRQPCLPVHISLPALSVWMERERIATDTAVLTFVRGHIDGSIHRSAHGSDDGADPASTGTLAPGDVLGLVPLVPWLIVFDGLDEVTAARDNQRVSAAIDAFLSVLHERDGRVIALATTRPQGYREQLARGFTARWLVPLTTERALAYASKLIRLRYPGDHARQAGAIEQLQRACREPDTERLMRTPLQVAIMTDLVEQIGQPPRQRWRLFRDYYEVIYQREHKRPYGPAAELLREYRTHIEDILQHLGLLLQVAGERSGHAQALVSGAVLEKLIATRLASEGFSEVKRDKLARDIRAVAENRLVFLVPVASDGYGFELRSLQEFMAAEALMRGRERDIERRLVTVAPAASWRNVLLFAAGKCFAPDWRHLRDMLVGVCRQLNAPEWDDPAAPGSAGTSRISATAEAGAGASLAMDILQDGSVDAPRYRRELSEVALALLALPPRHEQVVLASLGGEVDETLRQALTEDWPVDLHVGYALGRWLALVTLCDRGLDWANKLAAARWPRQREVRRLIVYAVHSCLRDSPWLWEQVARCLDSFTPWELPYTPEGPSSLQIDSWLALERLCVTSPPVELELATLAFFYEPWAFSELLARVQAMSEVPSSWLPFIVALPFVEQPGKDRLAQTLRALTSDFDARACHWWSSRLPWPLGGFLAVVERAEELLQWAEQVETGAVGDIAEWRRIEGRWLEPGGVTFEELVDTLERWPHLGAIAARDSWSATWSSMGMYLPIDDKTLAQVVQMYSNTVRKHANRVVAQLFWFLWPMSMFRTGRRSPECPELDAEQLLALYLDAHDEDVFHQPMLDKFDWLNDLADDDIAMILDELGQHFAVWHPVESWPDRLVALYRNNSDRHGILHILAEAARYGHSVTLPAELLTPGRFSDPQARLDAQLLRLLNGAMTLAEATAWLCDLAAIADAELAHESRKGIVLRDCLRWLRDQPDVSDAHLDGLCNAVLAATPADAWWLRKDVLDELSAYLRGRFTGLDAEAAWYGLGLDAPAPSALQDPDATSADLDLGAPEHARGNVITSLILRNLRVFDRFTMGDLPRLPTHVHATGAPWLVLLGENGVGKSTILRALALALVELTTARFLVENAPSPFLRKNCPEGRVEVTLDGIIFTSDISVVDRRERAYSRSNNGPERPPLFAYGCARGSAASGEKAPPDDRPIYSVLTLFDDSARLTPAKTWLTSLYANARAHEDEPDNRHAALYETVIATLCDLLPGVDDIKVDGDGPWFQGPKVGERVPLGALSDGYITTIGWIVDLLYRWVKRAQALDEPLVPGFNRHMHGVVLVDEIDLHLHPSWQIELIPTVRRAFPRLSFVVTTHNPLTVMGARAGEVVVLRAENGSIRAIQHDIPPGIRADQVLTGEWFGLVSARDPETLSLLEEHYRQLRDNVPASDPERVRVEAELRQRLDEFPGTTLEQLIRKLAADHLDGTYPPLNPDQRTAARDALSELMARELGDTEPGAE